MKECVVDLGEYVPALGGWKLLISTAPVEDLGDYIAVVAVDEELAEELGEEKLRLLALYWVAREMMDYRVAAAMHIYRVKHKVALSPEELSKHSKRVEVRVRFRRREKNPFAWEAVFWRGACYAQTLLNLEKPAVVKVEPPKDPRARERLRYLLEGARISRGNKVYRVGGLLKKLGGRRLAPWVYVVVRKQVPQLVNLVRKYGGECEVIPE